MHIHHSKYARRHWVSAQSCTGMKRFSGWPRLHNVHCNDMHINECKDPFQPTHIQHICCCSRWSARFSLQIITIIYNDASCWQSLIILCDGGNGDGWDCFRPLSFFEIQMMGLIVMCDGRICICVLVAIKINRKWDILHLGYYAAKYGCSVSSGKNPFSLIHWPISRCGPNARMIKWLG